MSGPHASPPDPPLDPDQPARADGQDPPRPVIVRVESLHKAFSARPVLAGVNLEIARGEIVAIVGGSGVGKTVLLEHIIGQMSADRGRVLMADYQAPGMPLVDLAELDDEQMDDLRTHWAIVFQRNALFSGTVYENIALWLREIQGMDESSIERRARAVLAEVGFADDDAVLQRQRDELSGGMAKRIAVARALAMDPLLLFYDEPTTGLDPMHSAQIHKLIHVTHHRLREDGAPTTTIIITHDKDLLRRLRPRIVMLHDGRVFFDGSYQEFEQSESPIIRPYFELMPALQLRPMGS